MTKTNVRSTHKLFNLFPAFVCLLVLGFGLTGLDSVLSASQQDSAQRSKKALPNIVLIISDDQAWSDYGFMDHDVIETPCLDKLAAESCTFSRGYVPTALCRPSLASIITGLYPHQHKICGNDPSLFRNGERIKSLEYQALRKGLIAHIDAVPTLPRLLAKNGYRCFQTGKWWEGNFSRGGFSHGMTHGDPKRGGRHGDEGLKISRAGIQPIKDFLDKTGDAPFFLWHAPFLPHTPHNPPAQLLKKYTVDGRPPALARYFAMCEWFDQTCGDLLEELDHRGLSDDTLVIYVTDNGWIQKTDQTQVPEKWKYQFAPKSKQSPNEAGVRTPILFRWPGNIEPRFDSKTLVSSIDLAPTLLEIVGIEQPKEMLGISLLELATNSVPLKRDMVFGEGFAHDVADIEDPSKSLLFRWVIQGEWKLIEQHDGIVGRYKVVHPRTKQFQLFDLANDPHEQNELSRAEPEHLLRMKLLLEQFPGG